MRGYDRHFYTRLGFWGLLWVAIWLVLHLPKWTLVGVPAALFGGLLLWACLVDRR